MGTPGWKRQEPAEQRQTVSGGGGQTAPYKDHGTCGPRAPSARLPPFPRLPEWTPHRTLKNPHTHTHKRRKTPAAGPTAPCSLQHLSGQNLTLSVPVGVKLLTAAFVVARQSHGEGFRRRPASALCPFGWILQKVLRRARGEERSCPSLSDLAVAE